MSIEVLKKELSALNPGEQRQITAFLVSLRDDEVSHPNEEMLRGKIAGTAPNPQPFTRLTTVGGNGLHPGVSIDNSAALSDLLEQGG